MDSFITLIILILIFSGLLERLLKGKSGSRRTPPSGPEGSANPTGADEALGRRQPRSELERIILEQLGIRPEPPSTVETRPGPAEGAGHPELEGRVERTELPTRTPDRASPGRVVHPRGRAGTDAGERGRPRPGGRRELRRRKVARRGVDRLRRARQTAPTPVETGEIPEVVSLEEVGMREIGEPTSLERPREPADHDRFHRRYSVQQPVATHDEYHRRYVVPPRHRPARERRARLPRQRSWSEVQRAIVWTEVIGPPKGLVD